MDQGAVHGLHGALRLGNGAEAEHAACALEGKEACANEARGNTFDLLPTVQTEVCGAPISNGDVLDQDDRLVH